MEYKNLWIVIPAAGDSRRFRDVGYMTPKPFLELQHQEGGPTEYMIQFVINSVDVVDPKFLIVIRNDMNLPMSLEHHHVLRIRETIGQADTVYRAVKELPPTDPVMIMDCDMVLQADDIDRILELLKSYDSVIAVAKTFDPNASRIDQVPHPTRFVEKEPISEWGIVGVRAFRSAGLLAYALQRTLARYEEIHREPYLSVAINHIPGTKYAHVVKKFLDWGTPERIKESGFKIV